MRPMQQVGVQQAFYVNHPNLKSSVPLVLEVVVKQGDKPIFKQYDDCKREYPLLLLEYYERLVNIHRRQDDTCQTPDRRDRDSIGDREEFSAKDQMSSQRPRPRERERERQRDRERERQKEKEKQKQRERERQREKQRQRQKQKQRERERERAAVRERPVRSCRRKDGYNLEYIEQMPYQPSYSYSHYQQQQRPPPIPSPPASPEQSIVDPEAASYSESLSSLQDFKRMTQNRILDYDQIIEEDGLHLISPAVIPACKGKADRVHIQPGTCYPPLPAPKENDREFSSQGFKDSEESEFLLDDRVVRERRRREKFQMREQSRNKRKRSKKIIKRKKPPGSK